MTDNTKQTQGEAPSAPKRGWMDYQLWKVHEEYRKGLENEYSRTHKPPTIPKYKTLYPNNFQAELPTDLLHIIWIKDKADNKKHLVCLTPNQMSVAGNKKWEEVDGWATQFAVSENKLYLSSKTKAKRLLIKYIPT